MALKIKCVLLIVSLIFLTSCVVPGANWIPRDDKAIATETLGQIITAVLEEDEDALKHIFSQQVCEDEANHMDESIAELMDFFQGEVLEIDDSAGIGMEEEFEHGHRKIEISSAFSVTTSEREYDIAIKQCTENSFEPSGVGVTSLYIVAAENWTVSAVFQGDGNWTPGIHIIDEEEAARIIQSTWNW